MEGEVVTNVDSQGYSFKQRRFLNDAGELWTCPPAFSGAKQIIEGLKQLKLRNNEVILTTFPKAGRCKRFCAFVKLVWTSQNVY